MSHAEKAPTIATLQTELATLPGDPSRPDYADWESEQVKKIARLVGDVVTTDPANVSTVARALLLRSLEITQVAPQQSEVLWGLAGKILPTEA